MAERVTGAQGVPIEVAVAGRQDAPPLVLLHALGESSASWGPVLAAFRARFRTVAPDLRGHGASGRGASSYDLMRDDVLEVVAALGLERFALVGHSLGGVVALLVAAARPDAVTALVVEDVVPPYGRDRPVPDRPAEDPPFDWAMLTAMLAETDDPERRRWPELARIAAPTLFVGGGAASHIPSALLHEAAALIPEARVVELDTGHFVHDAQPERFARLVLDHVPVP